MDILISGNEMLVNNDVIDVTLCGTLLDTMSIYTVPAPVMITKNTSTHTNIVI